MNRIDQLEAALEIAWPEVRGVRVGSIRRQTGPGLIWDQTGVVVDLYLDGVDGAEVLALWQTHARRVLDALGWTASRIATRRFHGGVNLAVSAPVDRLYTAVFVAQTAWHFCASELAGEKPISLDTVITDLEAVMAQEANPALIALIAAAESHGIDILIDDDEVSLGHGTGSQTWPVMDLPSPEDITWADLHSVPLMFITGTNGKTTTTRLCAAIAAAADKVVGLTSTDVAQVGGDILDRGDYSGPAGGRMVLRDPRVEIACLEVARGGILRRGLPTKQARVAVVTNVAKDHLGDYGVMTVPELAEVKFAVARALAPNGVLVLNADDPVVVGAAASVDRPIWWFSLDENTPLIAAARDQGVPCAYLSGGTLAFFDGTKEVWSIATGDVPMTLSGAAKHNVSNALAAIAASFAMGLPPEVISAGLTGFRSDPQDNPGRLNLFHHNGARVFVDYAHNPHSIAAVCAALAGMPAKRRFLMISQPGDRSDLDIAEAATTALRFGPDVCVVAEIADYLRGRALGETPRLLTSAARGAGLSEGQITQASSPSDGAAQILAQLGAGDLALLLVLADREAVFELLSDT